MAKTKGNGEKKTGDGAASGNKASIKIHMHCEGCVREIEKCLMSAKGVKSLQTIREKSVVNVDGSEELDPLVLIKRLEKKTKKKPTLLSPAIPNKNNNPEDAKQDQKEKAQKKSDDAGVLILKIDPPCEGCFVKIRKLINKNRVELSAVSAGRDAVTVKGAKKALEALADKLPKTVKIVVPPPPKKEVDGGGAGKDDGGGGGGGKRAEVPAFPSWSHFAYPPGWGPAPPGYPVEVQPVAGHPPGYGFVHPYGYSAVHPAPAPQMFSDENPWACSVM